MSPTMVAILAAILPCEQRPFDLPDLSRKIEGPLLAGYCHLGFYQELEITQVNTCTVRNGNFLCFT